MKTVRVLLTLAYPLLVFAGLKLAEPRWIALGLAVVVGIRAVLRWREVSVAALRPLLPPVLAVGTLLAVTLWWNHPLGLLLLPVLINASLLLTFGRTLVSGPSYVESVARLQVPDLPDVEVNYCRTVTWAWCGFFVVNGAIALTLALAGDAERWAIYTGLVSYLLIALGFAIEFVVRSWRFGRYEGTFAEPLFRRLFPRTKAT